MQNSPHDFCGLEDGFGATERVKHVLEGPCFGRKVTGWFTCRPLNAASLAQSTLIPSAQFAC